MKFSRAIAALLLVGCASTVWVNDNAARRLEHDRLACTAVAIRQIGLPPARSAYLNSTRYRLDMLAWQAERDKIENECLAYLGWREKETD